jgi:hypothetical protein
MLARRSATPHEMNETAEIVKRSDNVFNLRRRKRVIGTPMAMMITPTTSLIADTALLNHRSYGATAAVVPRLASSTRFCTRF